MVKCRTDAEAATHSDALQELDKMSMDSSRKPHICFITEFPGMYGLLTSNDSTMAGGAEIQQMLIAKALLEIGYTVTFLVPDAGQPDEIETKSGIRVIKTFRQSDDPGILGRFVGIINLWRALRRAKADIFYQRTRPVLTGLIALFCNSRRKSLIYSVGSNKWADGSWKRQVPKLIIPFSIYGLRRAVIIAQSEEQQKMVSSSLGKEAVVIRSTFSMPIAGECVVPQYVLWVGNFGRVKRPEMFVELARRLPECKFLMVGGPRVSEESLFDEIRSKSGNVPNLEMTGSVPYEQVGRYFDQARVLVNTSASEGFPNTYLQAWCRGVPVAATYDVDDLLSKRDLGIFCQNIDELEAGVRRLASDTLLCKDIGERAKSYVLENHSPSSVAQAYDSVFMHLWDNQSNHGRRRS